MGRFDDVFVLIKGAGDLASGVAARLHRCGFPVVMTELARPLMVRRAVSFGEAVYEGKMRVQEINAQRVRDASAARAAIAEGLIPVIVDPETACRHILQPDVVIDAVMAKHNTGTTISDAPFVVALGPGFTAGQDCHAVVETNRGHWLGHVIWQGTAQPDTGVPGDVAGHRSDRVLRAPAAGPMVALATIGDRVAKGQLVATVNGAEVLAGIAGVLRGLLRSGLEVAEGTKIGDVDPRAEPAHCFTISDKSLAIGGGVLEAILHHLNSRD